MADQINRDIGKIWHNDYEFNGDKDYANPDFRIVERIYGDTRDMAVNLLDLSNIAKRLRDYIGRQGEKRKFKLELSHKIALAALTVAILVFLFGNDQVGKLWRGKGTSADSTTIVKDVSDTTVSVKTMKESDSTNRISFRRDSLRESEQMSALRDAVKEMKGQFDIEHRPHFNLTNFQPINYKEGKSVTAEFTVTNLGKYPIEVVGIKRSYMFTDLKDEEEVVKILKGRITSTTANPSQHLIGLTPIIFTHELGMVSKQVYEKTLAGNLFLYYAVEITYIKLSDDNRRGKFTGIYKYLNITGSTMRTVKIENVF